MRSILHFLILLPVTKGTNWGRPPLRWVDNGGPTYIDMDIFFDRAVAITLDMPIDDNTAYIKEFNTVAIGVLITNEHVLTSYNPFRSLTKDKDLRKKMVITVLAKRKMNNLKLQFITFSKYNIACGRQVIPMSDNDVTADQWHGTKKMHSPLHDLMVLRLIGKITFLDPNPKLYSFDLYPKTGADIRDAAPLKTEVAKPGQPMGRKFKFASTGHLNDNHIWKGHYLLTVNYEYDDNAIVECDRWIPREWGHFICVRNIHGLEALGSGGLLIYNGTLYGLGCFALRKSSKKTGILVFTDVRAYYDLIFQTCTVKDQI